MRSRALPVLIPVLVFGFASVAPAADSGGTNVAKTIQSQGCSGCHTAKTQRVGPAWSWIAWHYRAKPGQASVDEVAKFIVSGGVGYWAKWTGGIPMPAHSDLSMAQAQAIARWVLAQPPIAPPKPGG